MKIVICDDDEKVGVSTQIQIEKINNLFKCVYMNFDDVYELINNGMFDFDILVTEIKSKNIEYRGIELVRNVNELCPTCEIIYMTDNINYAPMVYETKHCYFVLKNMEQMLRKALNKATERHSEVMRKNLITFLSGGHNVILLQEEINYVERYDRSLKIITDRNVFYSYMSLRKLCELLSDRFVRCHGSFIVNLDRVSSVSNKEICLRDDTKIPVGNRFFKGFMERYMEKNGR